MLCVRWLAGCRFDANSSSTTVPRSPCDPNITDDERRLNDRVQSLASLFTVVESVAWGIPGVIVTVLLGAGSDRLGRRHVLTVCD